MASLVRAKAKGFSVQWYDDAGERLTLYLGRVPRTWACEFHRGIERLLEHQRYGEPVDKKTRTWLSELTPKWRSKLAEKGLVEAARIGNLGELIAAGRARLVDRDASAENLRKFDNASFNLLRRFDPSSALGTITQSAAVDYADWLHRCGRQDGKGGTTELSPETVSQQVAFARSLFDLAEDQRFVDSNPFDAVTIAAGDPDAQQYVPVEVVERLLERCSPALALRVALARYGGLRHPSEVDALRIEWVDLVKLRMVVYSPKNKRFKHKRYREIPIDPRLAPHLEDAIELADPGEIFVAYANRGVSATAWRQSLERACKRAALVPWIGLWNSLRGSRAVDLLRLGIPEHTVVKWQNTSVRVLRRSYLRPTELDFAVVNGQPIGAAEQAEVTATPAYLQHRIRHGDGEDPLRI